MRFYFYDNINITPSLINITFSSVRGSNNQFNMKYIVALFAIVAAASAGLVVPGAYSAYNPLAYSVYPYAGTYAGAYAAPIAHTYASPIAYAAPVAAAVPIQSGYVAQTRGSLHIAPHPEGPFTASHHINTAPAPGTY